MHTSLLFRLATAEDIPTIVNMLACDKLGATRENAGDAASERYVLAFEKIRADPNQN